MKLLCDENLPRALADRLRADGHDAVDVREIGLTGASDDDVLARAVAEQRVLITSDVRRFANVILTPPAATPGIVVVRFAGVTTSAVIDRICAVIANTNPHALTGALTIVEAAHVRRRC